MTCLAQHRDEPLTSKAISDKVEIRSEYLAKVLGTLSRAGLVSSRRGRGGGFTLAKSPEETTVLEIVKATEPMSRFEEARPNVPEASGDWSPLHELINLAIADVEQRFQSVTLDRMLPTGNGQRESMVHRSL
jgi:Rrf2 family protein